MMRGENSQCLRSLIGLYFLFLLFYFILFAHQIRHAAHDHPIIILLKSEVWLYVDVYVYVYICVCICIYV